jgi:NAD(P)-dependent dehydrogenase (short-subunit alcohol dehydrogenase family)
VVDEVDPEEERGRPVTLITGAAGRLGSAVAAAILSRGSIAVLSDVNWEALARCVRALQHGEGQLLSKPADLTGEEEARRLVEEVTGELGRLDACVNCAGIEGPVGPIDELDMAQVIDVYQINVFGVLRIMKHALGYFKTRRAGRIVNIASGAGLAGSEYMAAYSSSKHAVVGLTRSAAREAAEYNVSVNAVCPGCIESPMMGRIEASLQDLTGTPTSFVPAIPMKRYAQPAEVADLVAYLALDAPPYITGAAVVIDGALRA